MPHFSKVMDASCYTHSRLISFPTFIFASWIVDCCRCLHGRAGLSKAWTSLQAKCLKQFVALQERYKKRINMLYYHGNCGKHTFPNKYYFFSMVWSNENHMCKSAIRAVVQAAANRKYREWTLPYKGFLLQKYNVKTRCRQKTLITDGNVITGTQNTFLINLNHMRNVFIFQGMQ